MLTCPLLFCHYLLIKFAPWAPAVLLRCPGWGVKYHTPSGPALGTHRAASLPWLSWCCLLRKPMPSFFFFFFDVHHLSSPKPPLSCVAAMPFCWCYGGHTPHLGPCPSVPIPSGSRGTLDCSEVWSWPSATGWALPAVPKPMCVPTASWTTSTCPVCCSRKSLFFRKMLLCPTGLHLQNANPNVNLLGISRWQQQRTKPSMGPSSV